MTYRDGPGSAKRVRCAKHRLVYDPQQTAGCVLCQRGEPAVPAPTAVRLLRLLLILTMVSVSGWGSIRLARDLLFRERVPVGQACSPRRGCVEGAHCLALGLNLPPVGSSRGTCFRICETDGQCAGGQRCVNRGAGHHCMEVAAVGDACGAGLDCVDGADCLSPPDDRSGGRCRKRCTEYGARCPAGQTCAPIQTAPALPGPMAPPWRHETYCVPASL